MIFMRYMNQQRGGRSSFTEEELSTVLKNQAPGSPNLSILSFKGCFHGRTIGLLSCSHSRPIQGVDIPTLPWPKADFPRYKYPLEENSRENQEEDERCLAQVEELIEAAVSGSLELWVVLSHSVIAGWSGTPGGGHHLGTHPVRGRRQPRQFTLLPRAGGHR